MKNRNNWKTRVITGLFFLAPVMCVFLAGCPDPVAYTGQSGAPAAEAATAAKAQSTQKSVDFTLTSTHAEGAVWKVYGSETGGEPLDTVSASFSGSTLTLAASGDDLAAGTYWVSVTEDGKTESARLALTVAAYSINGTVTSGGSPLEGATVSVSNGGTPVTAVSDSSGKYILGVPLNGGYTITVTRTGYKTRTAAISVEEGPITADFDLLNELTGTVTYDVDFDDFTSGAFTANGVWTTGGAGTIEIIADEDDLGDKVLHLKRSGGSFEFRNASAAGLTGTFTIEMRVKRGDTTGNQYALYTNNDSGSQSNSMANIILLGAEIRTHPTRGSGTSVKMADMAANTWYTAAVVVDTATDTFDFYVDGVKVQAGASTRTVTGGKIDYLHIFSTDSTSDVWVDYLRVYGGGPQFRVFEVFTIFMAGDSTMCFYDDGSHNNSSYTVKQRGWGQYVQDYIDSRTARVSNQAYPGASSKTFTTINSGGNYNNIFNNIKSGDYLLIQFGHNDGHDPANSESTDATLPTSTEGSFKWYLNEKYIKPARAKGAIPVLITPVCRRNPETGGRYPPGHEYEHNYRGHADAVRALAEETGAALIDLEKMSGDLLDSLSASEGAAATAQLYAVKSSGETDVTHFCEYGAKTICGLVIDDIIARNLIPGNIVK